MTDDTTLPFDLPSVHRKKITVDFDGGNQSSDGGLLLLREAERKLGVCQRLAEAMPDRRDPDRIQHAMFEMVMARVSAIACGHKDAIDLDRLRHDPLMKIAVGRCPESGAARRGPARSVRHHREAGQGGDPRYRRHFLCGPWRPATGVLERASRRARLCVDAHLSRDEQHAGGGHPAPGAHSQGHGGEDRHQACDDAPERALAGYPHRVARRRPLRPRRGHGMGGGQRRRLYFRPRRQCGARCPGGRDRRQSALPSRQEQPDEDAHLCELHLPGRQLDTAAQSGGAARMLAAA